MLALLAGIGAAEIAAAFEPFFISVPPTSAFEDQPYSYTMQAIDLDPGQTVTYGALLLPSWLTFNGANAISGTPLQEHVGAHPVTVTASDGQSTRTQSFQIVVHNTDDPPRLVAQITPDPQRTAEDAPYSFGIASFFADEDGDVVTFSAADLPPVLAIDAQTGVISGEPRGGGRTGSTSFTITVNASNAGGSASDAFVLVIDNQNDPPVLPDPPPTLTTVEDTPLDVTPELLNAQDSDLQEGTDETLTTILTSPPAGAHFTVDNNGTTVRPDAEYSGPLQVEARVRDASGAISNAVLVAITVTPVNDAPRATTIPPQTATESTPFSFATAPYFSDVENDPLTYQATGLPPSLALDPATGVIAGTPPANLEPRDYTVTLTAHDGQTGVSTQFVISLIPIGRADLVAGVAVAPNPSLTGNPATWTFSIQNDSSVEVPAVSLDAVFRGSAHTLGAPSHASCSVAPGTETSLSCQVGPVAAKATVSVTVPGTSAGSATVHAAATIAIVGTIPIDPVENNNRASATLSVAEQLSGGPSQRLVVSDARAAAAGDLDGDGFLDLAVATAGAQGPLLFPSIVDPANSNKRVFADSAMTLNDTTPGSGVAIGDLDADGDLDIVTANAQGQTNKVFVNDGAAAFTIVALARNPNPGNAVAIADLNGDGLTDLVFANDNASTIYRNRGALSFARMQTLGPADGRDAALADLSGDALPELVLAHGDADAIVYRNVGGTLQTPVALPTGPTTSIAASDFDGDGDLDLVFGRTGAAGAENAPTDLVFLNTSGTFALHAELPGTSTNDVVAADFDHDGDGDILTIGANGGHRIYLNDGAAAFTLHGTQFVHAGATTAVAGSLSVDARTDVAVAGTTAVGVFLNDGKANLGAGDNSAPDVRLVGEPTVTVTVGQPYQDAGATATDDVDGDLTTSIVVRNPVDTAVIGSYSVTYDVADSSGNVAPTVTRTVEVKPQSGTGGGGGGALALETLFLLFVTLIAARHHQPLGSGAWLSSIGRSAFCWRSAARQRVHRS